MVEILGANLNVPSFGIGTGKITIVLSIFLIIIAFGIFAWIIFLYRTYNRKIIVFENVSGQGYQLVLRDRARVIKLGSGGEELLFLKKKKVYRTAYGKKMGKNTYWFAVGQDGYWYNVVLGDVDAKMGMLDIEPIDRDMRYMHVAIRKNIQDSYKKQTFMEKYGGIVISGLFLLIMLIGIWYLLDEMAEISSGQSASLESAQKVQEASAQTIIAVNNLIDSIKGVESGSGIQPAEIT